MSEESNFDVTRIPTMTDEELTVEAALLAEEQTTIQVQIESRIASGSVEKDWHIRAKGAANHKRLQRQAILQELRMREAKAFKEAKALKHQIHIAHIKDAKEARQARQAERVACIQEANAENQREIAMFKTVARDVLGDAVYMQIWNEVKRRQGGSA